MDYEVLVRASQAATSSLGTTFQRPLQSTIDWDAPMLGILGPRGVGKTTLLLQRLRELGLSSNEALYIDLGDLYFRQHRLYDFVERFIEMGGRYLFIDEVHRYGHDSWATELKMIYDYHHRRPFRVVFTGSSVLKILNRQADLSRRVLYYRMQGLSFREYLNVELGKSFNRFKLADLLKQGQSVQDEIVREVPDLLLHFANYLRYGYYPFYRQGVGAVPARVNNSVSAVLESDIPKASGVSAADDLKLGRLLAAIASSVPFKPNITKLAERTQLSRVTLLRYLSLLERSNLIRNLRAAGSGIAPLAKPDKIFLDNTTLLYALAPNHATTGTVRETFFLNQLSYLVEERLSFPPEVSLPKRGDFLYEHTGHEGPYVFEVGGPNKESKQIKGLENAYTVVDTLRVYGERRLPLWLFGWLY